ncbi:hypothetical protein BH10ACT6_BH10ACT6_00110 [soil metagenome]
MNSRPRWPAPLLVGAALPLAAVGYFAVVTGLQPRPVASLRRQ